MARHRSRSIAFKLQVAQDFLAGETLYGRAERYNLIRIWIQKYGAGAIGDAPKAIEATLQEWWTVSDTREAFAAALTERGYHLAPGNRRGFVAVDYRGEIFTHTRTTGIKVKDMRTRLGDPTALPLLRRPERGILLG